MSDQWKKSVVEKWRKRSQEQDNEIERLKPFEERSKKAIKYMNTNYKEFDSATYDIILKEILEGKQ